MNEAELEAKYLLEDLGINSFPIDPFSICRELQVSLFERPFDGLEGVLLYNGQDASIGLNSRQNYLPRKKFSISHELGHFCLDIDHGKPSLFQCTGKTIEGFSKVNNIELRADQFASELLLPQGMIKKHFDFDEPSWTVIKYVANIFETSLMSVAFKYMNLSKASCCLVVSNSGVIKYYRPSKNFRYGLQMNESRILSTKSFAYKAMKSQPISDGFDIVSADIWISGRSVTKDSELCEWSLPVDSFGNVLTILWDDESVLVEDDVYLNKNPYDLEEKNYSYDGVDNFPWEPPHLGKKK